MQEGYSLAQLRAAIFCSFQGQCAFSLLPRAPFMNPDGNKSQDYMPNMLRIYLTMSTPSRTSLSRISGGLQAFWLVHGHC